MASHFAFAQPQLQHFESYQGHPILSGNNTKAFYKGSAGFLWMSTNSGFYRFSGQQLKSYAPPALKGKTAFRPNTLVADSLGNLWIGAQSGLWYYQLKENRWTNYRYSEDALSSRVHEICPDAEGNLWVGMVGGGLGYFNTQQRAFVKHYTQEDGLPNNFVLYAQLQGQDTLWVSTRSGLVRLHIPSQRLSQQGLPEVYKTKGPHLFKEKRTRRIWFSNEKATSFFNIATQTFVSTVAQGMPPALDSLFFVYGMYESPDGDLWISQQDKGVVKYNPATGKAITYQPLREGLKGLQLRWAQSFYKDEATGILWIGSNNGVFYLPPASTQITRLAHQPHISGTLDPVRIRSMYEDSKGVLWIGTQGNGLYAYDINQKKFVANYRRSNESTRGLGSDSVFYVTGDATGRLWIGYTQGFDEFDGKRFTYHTFPDLKLSNYEARAMHVGPTGKLWLGMDRDLFAYDPEGGQLEKIDISSIQDPAVQYRVAEGFLQPTDSVLWFGSIFGLNRLHLNTNKLTNHRVSATSEAPKYVRALVSGGKDKIWMNWGTGLAYINTHSLAFTQLSIPANEYNITALMPDGQGRLWGYTREGAFRYNPAGGAMAYLTFNDGVFTEAIRMRYHTGASGRHYLGDKTRVYFFHPDSLALSATAPRVALTGLKLFNEPVAVNDSSILQQGLAYTKSITLGPNDDIFSISFEALNYHNTHLNQYAYRLEGFQEEWIHTNAMQPEATYTSLKEGKYTFQVKARVGNGGWAKQLTTLNIVVLPPWWRTWWAKVLWLLLAFGVPLLFYYLRVRNLTVQKERLAMEVGRQTHALREQNEEILQQKEEIISQKEEIETQKGEIEEQAKMLQATNTKMVALDSYKQGLTSMLVHDLKNPLNAVIGLTHGKSETTEAQKQRINQAGRTMLNLVNNMLEVQKLEETKPNLFVKEVFVKKLLEGALEDVALLIAEKAILMVNQVHDELQVKADADYLERVFVNLLTNAIKFSPLGGQVTLGYEVQGQDVVRLSVKDQGPGVPKGKHEKVFDKFSQVKAVKAGRARSTGLGLTFCRLVIEAHGGQIGLLSSEGEGACFWFDLPLAVPLEKLAQDTEEDNGAGGIRLSSEDKALLTPVAEKLAKEPVYMAGVITTLLAPFDNAESPTAQAWAAAVRNASYQCNEEKYAELLGQLGITPIAQ